MMDEMDGRLIKALKRDGRASVSELAADLGVTRATVKARLDRLRANGDIAGFSVLTRADVAAHPVRGLMMLGIEGRHSTNGTWDLIVELGTETLDGLDAVLFQIRRMQGVIRSETNLLLSTRRAGR